MKHNWDYSNYGKKQTDLFVHSRRKCKNCGKEQEKTPEHTWMRITRYVWRPKAGRCKGKT
jgi:hypothetical protein